MKINFQAFYGAFFSSIYIYSGTGKSGGGECIYNIFILSPSTVLYLVVAAHDTSHMLEEYIKGQRVKRKRRMESNTRKEKRTNRNRIPRPITEKI